MNFTTSGRQAGERAGIAFPLRIPGLDEGQNDDGLRVYVRENGSISRIEAVPAEQLKRIRKWKCGEGITLPVFNFEPLHTIRLRGKQPLIKRLNALSGKARLRLLRQQRSIRWASGSQSRLRKLAGAFKNVSSDLLAKIGEDADPNGAAWRTLLKILPTVDVTAFLGALSTALRERLGVAFKREKACALKSGLGWVRRLGSRGEPLVWRWGWERGGANQHLGVSSG